MYAIKSNTLMQNLVSNILKFNVSNDELAKKSGLEEARIAEIINGSKEPFMAEVRAIARALKVRPEFLMAEDNVYESVNTLFRENINSNLNPVYDKISYMLTNAVNILSGSYSVENIHAAFPEVSNDYEGVLKIATIFRQKYFNSDFVTPLLNLPEIATEQLNCVSIVTEIGKSIDGVSAIINDIPFIIISPRFKPRMLFTFAHELGHIIAHHGDKENFAVVDDYKLFSRKRGQEIFAHAFASEILLPQEGVAYTLKTIRDLLSIKGDHFGEIEILYLSRIYGVSFEVAALRCENLGVIPQGSAISLYESLIKEYGSPEKRADQLGLLERPDIVFPAISRNLMDTIIEKINSGDLSLGKAAELLSIPTADIISYNAKDGGYSFR